MPKKDPVLVGLRREYHKKIFDQILGYRLEKAPKTSRDKSGQPQARILSNSDDKVPAGVDIATKMAELIGLPLCTSQPKGQQAGAMFTRFTMEFVQSVFEHLQDVRPGRWRFTTSQGSAGIGNYEQYTHLQELDDLIKKHPELETALGSDYLIKPDIVVCREPLPDDELDATRSFIERRPNGFPAFTSLRARNLSPASLLMHASISCKWTMRSDRAQNSRTEALNLIRHRKGRTPHICVVTMEPAPSRLVSIAMGTGDVDCTYHAALQELFEGAKLTRHIDAVDTLRVMIEGKRLKDISDLPFDLAI